MSAATYEGYPAPTTTEPAAPAASSQLFIPGQRLAAETSNRLASVSSLPTDEADSQTVYFAHGSIRSPGGHGDIPYTATVSENLAQPLAHLLVPGFGGIKRSSRGLRNALTEDENIMAVSYEPGRRSSRIDDLVNPQKLHTDTVAAIIEDLPNNRQLQNTPAADVIDFSQIVLDPHSMGGDAATDYAIAHPESVALINYIETVGMEESAVMFGFIKRFYPTVVRDIGPAIIKGLLDPQNNHVTVGVLAGYYARNPLRTIGEMGSCMRANKVDKVIALGNLGVKRSMLYGAKDCLIPAAPAIAGAGHSVDYYEVDPDMGHLAPQQQARLVASHIAAITRKLLF